MEPTNGPHLFPDTFYEATLNSWASAIQQPHSEAQFCLIDSVVHYKAQSSLEHEFLVVYAHHPSGAQIVLGVDRNAERPSVAPKGAASISAKKLSLFPREAYDSVQVSHDGTPAPILQQHGHSVPLSSITFARTATARSDDDTDRSNDDADPQRLSLLHFSTLLLTISKQFPTYSLLQHQCYFFARATCLALIDQFGGVEAVADEGRRATWRGVHVSLFSTAQGVLLQMLVVADMVMKVSAATL